MIDCWTSNLAALRTRDPALAAAVAQATIPDGWELAGTPAAPSLRVPTPDGPRALHSLHDPRREAARALDAQYRADAPAHVLLGAGLGYPAEALVARAPAGRPLLVCFESTAMLAAACRHRDLGLLWAAPALTVACADRPALLAAAAETLFAAHGLETAQVVTLETHQRLFGAALAAGRRAVELALETLAARRTTAQNLVWCWRRNFLRNLAAAVAAPCWFDLAGRWAGASVVCVGAGPSLTAALGALPALARRAYVIAVDSAAAPLCAAGIVPDVVCAADAVAHKPRHLRRAGLDRRTVGVITEDAHPWFRRALPGPQVLVSRGGAPGAWLEARLGPRGALRDAFTVGHVAVQAAAHLGAREVLLVGLDFAVQGDRRHAAGVVTSWHDEAAADQRVRAPGLDGAPVETYPNLLLAARHLDAFLLETPLDWYDGRTFGLALAGCRRRAPEEFARDARRRPWELPLVPAAEVRARRDALEAELAGLAVRAPVERRRAGRAVHDLRRLARLVGAGRTADAEARTRAREVNHAVGALLAWAAGEPLVAEGFARAAVTLAGPSDPAPRAAVPPELRAARLVLREALTSLRRLSCELAEARARLALMERALARRGDAAAVVFGG